jgi:tetratricopeptide (TPR) repeat protein
MMPPPRPQVFISYQRSDGDFARQVREHLVAADVRTWMDQYDIPVGAYWPDEIDKGLTTSDVVVGILSPDAVESRNVKNEWDWVLQRDKPLLLLLARPTPDIPHRYVSLNFIDATGGAEQQALDALLGALGLPETPPADDGAHAAAVTVGAISHAPRPARTAPIRRTPPVLFGREGEQQQLRALLDATQTGHGSVVLVGGEAGIGKTALVDDLSTYAEEQGALVLWGHAYDLSVTPPYGPWLEIFRQYQSHTQPLPPAPAFVSNAEELARVGSQDTLFAAVADFFATVATHQPLLLVLDDLHWADQASLDFFRFLARQVADQRMLLVATYRSDEVHRRHPLYDLLPLLVRESGAKRLDVDRLAAEGHRSLVASRYALSKTDQDRLVDYLVAHAEGNPLYAGELLRMLEDHSVLQPREDRWQLGDLTSIHVPPLLRQVIDGRLRHLEPGIRALLQVGAVIGQEVSVELWQQVTGADDNTLIAALEQATEARLVEERPGGDTWRFHHALIREALYTDLVSLRRRGLHRQVAEQLALGSAPDPDMVAHHFLQASDPRAVEWLRNAGQRAERAYAWLTAVERYEALFGKLTEQGAPASERAVLLYDIARLQRYLDAPKTVELMHEARQLALEAGEQALAARCQYVAGMVRFWLGDFAESITIMEQASNDFESLPQADRDRLWSMLGLDADAFAGSLVGTLATVGRFDDAASLGARQVTNAPIPFMHVGQGESQYADALIGLAIVETFRGRPHEAQHNLEQARGMYHTIEHNFMLLSTCQIEFEWVQLPYLADDLEGRRRLAALGDDAARRSRSATPGLPLRWHVLGELVLAGAWSDAWEIATRLTVIPSWLMHSYGARWLVPLAVWRGDTDLAWRIIGQFLPAGVNTEADTTYFATAMSLQRLAAELAIAAGDLPTAHAWLEMHDRWLAWSGAVLGQADSDLAWSQYQRATGDLGAARQAAEQALARSSSPRQPLALLAAHRLLGWLDTTAEMFDTAEEHLQASCQLAESCRAPFERALTLLEIANLRMALGRIDDAQRLLDEVRSIVGPLGAAPTLERVATLEKALTTA